MRISLSAVPYRTRIDLPEQTCAQVIVLFNQRLADALDLQSRAKQAHWNVKGPHFFALHELFDALHEAVEGYADLLAERVVQLGGIASGTVRAAAVHSVLPEDPPVMTTGAEHVHALAESLAMFGGHVRAAIRKVADLGDAVSADICTEIARDADKWLWIVESHVQSHAEEAVLVSRTNGDRPTP